MNFQKRNGPLGQSTLIQVWSTPNMKACLAVTMPHGIPQSGVCTRIENKSRFPVLQLKLAKTALP